MKYLHTMVRVTDLEASLKFYRDALGLDEVRRSEHQAGRFTLNLGSRRLVAADDYRNATNGYTGLKHALLGSVAEKIVRHAPCPVLTVRPEERDFL